MNRENIKKIKKLCKSSLILALPLGVLQSCSTREKPNIIFIMSDDHAEQAISSYNGKLNLTPNIDRIAEQGVRFENSFCTNSICAPSRAVLLTGKYSHINAHINNSVSFDGSQQTFPKLLQDAGYQTAMIGKWHLKSDPTGFDYWNILPGQGNYYNPDFIEMGKRKNVEGYVTDLITDYALDWLNKINKEKPFCLLLHHKAPHRNWMPGPEHLNMFDDTEIPIPETYFDDYSSRGVAAHQQKMSIARDMYLSYDLKLNPEYLSKSENQKENIKWWNYIFNRLNEEQKEKWRKAYDIKNKNFFDSNLKGKELAKWKYQRYIKDYLRCIASVDDNVGRVLDYLKDNGLSENTIVVYTSDQGFYLGEHGWFDKRFMYEESLSMPLIIKYPKEINPGVNKKNMVLNLDFAPTFLDYAGIEVPEDIQGESMRTILSEPDSDNWRESLYYHYYEYPGPHSVKRHYGVRTKRYKLIHYYCDVDEWELFDLHNDPGELNNIINNEKYVDVIKDLKAELKHLRKKYNDTDADKFMPQKNIVVEHKAINCPVLLEYQYAEKYPAGGENALTDGLCSPERISFSTNHNIWQGFHGDDLNAVIDLKTKTDISGIDIGFLQKSSSWIFLPEKVEFFISDDGKEFKSVEVIITDKSKNESKSISKVYYSADFNTTSVKYIKIKAKNIGVCPEWHPGAGEKAWIFTDEIIVN